MPQTMLYYPWINIQNDLWLKSALLYWDHVSTIVPHENYDDLSPDLLYLQDRGAYIPIYPSEIFTCDNDVNEFSQILQNRIAHCFLNSNLTNHAQMHRNKFAPPQLRDMIHYNKIPLNIAEMFFDQGLIRGSNRDEWYEIDEKVASLYMRTLAQYAAKYSDKDMVVGSDKTEKVSEIYRVVLAKRQTERNRCFSLILNHCLPQLTMENSFQQILDFKEARQFELNALRSRLVKLESTLARCESIEHIKTEIELFKGEWDEELKNADKLFKDHGLTYILGNIKSLIEVTAATAGIFAAFDRPLGPLFFGALGANGAIGLTLNHINYKRKISEARTSSGFAYIINAYRNGFVMRR